MTGTSHTPPARHLTWKAMVFVAVSGIGWLIDLGIFATLQGPLHVAPFWANLISATTAVTFVFFTTTKRVFTHSGKSVGLKYVLYTAYQLASITLFSALIAAFAVWLAAGRLPAGMPVSAPVASKIVITPLNLTTNFIFAALLIEDERRRRLLAALGRVFRSARRRATY